MLLDIAKFEFRYLLRNPLLWVTFAVTFLLMFVAMSVEGFDLGSGGVLLENAAYATLRNYLMIALVFMFVTTSFVADAVIRDDNTGFGPILRSSRITKFEYLFGRFLGAFAITAVCLLMVPLGILIGTLMPWADPGSLGPNRIGDHLYAFFLLGLPNLFIISAILFSLATITRSMMATYLGVLFFTSMFFLLQSAFKDSPQIQTLIAIAEPFGGRALNDVTRYWTVAERNVKLPEFTGILLYNRLVWLSISGFFLWLTYSTFRFAENGISRRKQRKLKFEEQESIEVPGIDLKITLPSPKKGFGSLSSLLWMRTKFEARQVIITPAYVILMLWGLFGTFTALLTQRDPDGRPSHPTTLSLIPDIQGAFDFILLIIAVYYAGELVWREKDRRIHELIDATPMPNGVYVATKTLAMGLVLISTLVITVLASIIVQLWLGHTSLEIGKYLLWFILPMSWDMLLMAALAIFVQALSPHKAVGWGIMVLLLIAQQLNSSIDHNLLLYGESSYLPLSDMNGAGSFWIGSWIFRIYWGAFAVLLLVVAHMLWRRGTEIRIKPRIAQAPRRLIGTTGWIAGAALVIFISTGTYAYYNTNILNKYQTQAAIEVKKAEFEKKYWKYHDLPQPTITEVKLDIALFPEQMRAVTKGSFILRNLTQEALKEVHVLLQDKNLTLTNAEIQGGVLLVEDVENQYNIFQFESHLQPGEELILEFETQRHQRGFPNDYPNTRIVENGTFLTSNEFMPVIGMGFNGLLNDPATRKKYGLSEELPLPKLEDITATRKPAVGDGWVSSEITLSSSEGQTPIAPGSKISDEIKNGRRTARFVSKAPMLNYFSIQSARYEKKQRVHKGIDLEVYYHKEHSWNVDRMLDALAASLDYYTENFGPYQFDHVRIVEFPSYSGGYAQAFAGTIPYSESTGFNADYSGNESIDHVTYTTSHELAHQYWAHQVVGAAMPGAALLSETLAQYSTLMVAKKMHGEDRVRHPLKYELDRYLRGRAMTSDEPPLIRVVNENHVIYHKGALAMYLLQVRMGEDAINRALRSLLGKYKFEGPPYPRSLDFIKAIRAEAKTEEDQALITDLFEKVTLYDLKVTQPTSFRRMDGKWDVTIPIEAKKFYVNEDGIEIESTLEEHIEIGLFTSHPGSNEFNKSDVIMLERNPISSGKQVLKFISDKKPIYAGVDPYNFYIDKISWDNISAVTFEKDPDK